MAQNVCPGSQVPNNWGNPLETDMNNITKAAHSAVSQLETFDAEFEARFPTSVYLAAPSSQKNQCKAECGSVTECNFEVGMGESANAWVGDSKYCFYYTDASGSSVQACSTLTVPSYSCGGGKGTWNVDTNSTADGLEAQADAYHVFQQTKESQRDQVLGTGFYGTLASLQKVENGSLDGAGRRLDEHDLQLLQLHRDGLLDLFDAPLIALAARLEVRMPRIRDSAPHRRCKLPPPP